MINNNSICIAP